MKIRVDQGHELAGGEVEIVNDEEARVRELGEAGGDSGPVLPGADSFQVRNSSGSAGPRSISLRKAVTPASHMQLPARRMGEPIRSASMSLRLVGEGTQGLEQAARWSGSCILYHRRERLSLSPIWL